MVEGLIRLMESDIDGTEPVNLGNPEEFTIGELLTKVLAIVPSAAAVTHHDLPQDDPRRRRPDIARARDLLGWEPHVALDDGLPQTARWFARELGASLPMAIAAE